MIPDISCGVLPNVETQEAMIGSEAWGFFFLNCLKAGFLWEQNYKWVKKEESC